MQRTSTPREGAEGGVGGAGGSAGGAGHVRGETAGGPGARGEVAGAPPPPTESPQAQADRKRRELEAAEEAKCKHIKEKVERGVWRAEYWKWLVPELVSKDGGPKLLYYRCTRGGPGVCEKLFSSANAAKLAKEHCYASSCRGCKQEMGQAALASKHASESEVGAKRASSTHAGSAGSAGSAGAGSSKQARITQHMVSSSALYSAKKHMAMFFYKTGTAFRLVEQPDLVAAFECLGMSKHALPDRKASFVHCFLFVLVCTTVLLHYRCISVIFE